MIFSYELEQHLLSALIKFPDKFSEISVVISERDFFSGSSNVNRTIFLILKQAIENSEKIDHIILTERVKSLGITFDENINVADYIQSLSFKRISPDAVLGVAKELKKFTTRREIYDSCRDVAKKMISIPASASYTEIIESADKAYNSQINMYESGVDEPENIYSSMEELIEGRGNNPLEEYGFVGPHKKLHDIYGSLLRAGNITVVVARAGVGKMMPYYSKIKTPNGWTTHGEIREGEKITCPDGSVATVSHVYPQGQKDVYRVHFADGRWADCGIDHLWKTYSRDNRGNCCWQVINTGDVMKKVSQTGKVYVPLVSESGEERSDLPINPYVLGIILGDGSCPSFGTGPAICTKDEEIYSSVKELHECGKKVHDKRNSGLFSFHVSGAEFGKKIIDLGLNGKKSFEKFIPEIYKLSGYKDKIDLIKGLMDSDGTVGKNGNLEFSTTSERLASDVQKIIWSIGGICKVKTRITSYTYKGEKKQGRLSYRVLIRFREPRLLFNLSRKRDRLSENYQYSDLKLQVVKVEKLKNQEQCYCIMVDHPDHLYVTDDYVVTHNTTWTLDYVTKVGQKYNVPVLHFDNGEMSKEELSFRQCAALSGVPMHLLESGLWRKAGDDIVKAVRRVWPLIATMQCDYYNVGGTSVDSMINILKRYYYSRVGRGKPLLLNFDYVKTSHESDAKVRAEWIVVGEMLDKFKKCIQKDISDDTGPKISMMTSVQSNRSGIVANKNSMSIIDDESIVSMSDRIIQFGSHLFILRDKALDEIQDEGDFGTHKLINIKKRHLGSLKKNFVNFEISNFGVEEKGDLRDILASRNKDNQVTLDDHQDDVPDMV
jgi:replicative DNA helicase